MKSDTHEDKEQRVVTILVLEERLAYNGVHQRLAYILKMKQSKKETADLTACRLKLLGNIKAFAIFSVQKPRRKF
jgi:hypothetical protein